ncbi:MAG TPA: DegV family protein [Anaerolineae bacterium]|nr:DegV family protein [Anaerolineae bacterium]
MIRIVTDSSADLSPQRAAELGVTVIPIRIGLGTRVYDGGVGIRRSDFYDQLARSGILPTARPPLLEEFHEAYRRLLKSGDQILSIHLSSKLSKTVEVAQGATKAFLGGNKITVVDSSLISWGLGVLVTSAAEAARRGATVEQVLRLIRGMIPHIYMVFYVENMGYLERRDGFGRRQRFTDGLIGVRPLLIVEDGQITPMERVRSRGKATDRLFEFVAEFARFEQAVVLQGRASDDTQTLFERLLDVFAEKRLDIKPYGPALATYLGPDALGVGVYEGL